MEAASNVAEPGISHENAKMEDKQNKAAQHGEVQYVIAAEARQEEATTAEGAETSVNKQPTRASRTAKVRAHGQLRRMRRRVTIVKVDQVMKYSGCWTAAVQTT